MSYTLQKSLVLLLCLSLALATQCPLDVSASRFTSITGDTNTFSSDFYDAFYEIKLNSVDLSYTLTGYKITEVDNLANSGFQAEEFTTLAGANWKILAVSQLGNCLLIDNRPNLIAFDTSDSSFASIQNLTQANFVSGKVNDDCSIVRLTLEGGRQKVFIDDAENSELIFPTNSLFDAYFIYGIDSTGVLKKVQESSISTVEIEASYLKTNPVSILNRKDLNSLFLVTSNEGETEYAVTIVNTLTDEKAYSKEWASGSFTGDFKAELSMDGNFIIVRDDTGFLLLLEITYTKADTPAVTVTEVALQNSEYNSLFAPESVVSMTERAVVVYLNGKLTYFQPYQGNLYYLAQIVEDLQLEAIKYANQTEMDIAFSTTYFFADQLGTCNVFPDDGGSGGEDGGDPIDESEISEDQEDVVDENGNVIRCAAECVSCNTKGVCKVCSLGYSLSSDGECVLCEGCKSCSAINPTECTSCFKPQVFNPTTKKCEKATCADANCLDCNFAGKCLQCSNGYSPYQGNCVTCQDGCGSCKNEGANTCDQDVKLCKQGFVYFPIVLNNVKFSCVQCVTGCLGCSISDISNCTACNDGFFNTLNSATNKLTCTSCLADCIKCTDATTCTKCESGFRLNAEKTKCLERCDESCLTCSETNITQCKSCYLGSQISGTQCVADLSCNQAKTCTSCGLGFALRTGQCIRCATGILNCIACSPSSITSCTRCAAGFYITQARRCANCATECATCQNEQACMSCTEGFYLSRPLLSATGRCFACRSTCKTCSRNPFLCTSCRTGFSLEGTKCINDYRVDYGVTLGVDVSLIALLIRSFILILIDSARKASVDPNNPLILTTDDITLKDIRKGSAILEGAMSTGDASQSNAIASGLSTSLKGIQLQGGFTILGVQVKAVVPTTTTTNSAQQSSTNLGLILGVAIPLCLIIIIGVILIVYKLRKRKEDLEEDNYSSNSGYFANESQKYVAKYSEESDKV